MSKAPYPYPPRTSASTLYPPLPARKRSFTLPLACLMTLITLALCALLALSGTAFLSHFAHRQPTPIPPTPTPVPTLPPLKVYKVIGKPTMSAAFINDVLKYYNSPAKGKGQALYDDGIHYGVNPAYALAFFLEESNFGTKGVATVTHALGNIRANPGEPEYKGYRLYKTWEEGFTDWYKLIATEYVAKWDLSTVDQIIPVYAPASDHNDEEQYIQTVKIAIERWRNGFIDI
jgi:Mannosyl-glycoprotein endo-beta-N-acetylglucosaminidase